MKNQFLPYELALQLKELGFNEECFGLYNPNIHLDFYSKNSNIDLITDNKNVVCSAPLWQQVIDWFRINHSIYIAILPFRDNEDEIELSYYYSLVQDDEELNDILCNEVDLGAMDDLYDNYEECRNDVIQKAIDLIK